MKEEDGQKPTASGEGSDATADVSDTLMQNGFSISFYFES